MIIKEININSKKKESICTDCWNNIFYETGGYMFCKICVLKEKDDMSDIMDLIGEELKNCIKEEYE